MTTTTTETTPSGGDHEAIAARLLQLRDELVVKNHLASMEVKDAVRELGHELEKIAAVFTRGVTTLSDDAKRRMHFGLLDANARFLEMETAVKAALAGAAHSAAVVVETARVKSALARMDAQDAVEARRKELKDELRHLEARGDEALRNLDARLTALGIASSKIV